MILYFHKNIESCFALSSLWALHSTYQTLCLSITQADQAQRVSTTFTALP